MKKPKKKSYYRNKCDALNSKLTREEALNTCQRCGIQGPMHAHHIVSKRIRRLRYDEQNMICLCSGYHKFRTNSAHENPIAFLEWFKDKYGEIRYNYLIRESNNVQPLPFDFYEGEWAKLKERENKPKELIKCIN